MRIESYKEKIKANPKLKRLIHWMIINPRLTRPRLWIKWFVNPFFTKRGKGSIVRRNSILNISPINRFCLGERSVVEDYCVVDNGVGDVVIGSGSRIGLRNTVIGPITVGNNVILAQNVVLSGLNHNYEDIHTPIRKQGVSKSPIVIEDDAWIGANSVITAGVTIGKHSIVAAGSVVVKDIPPFSICAGVPAIVIKVYDPNSNLWISTKR